MIRKSLSLEAFSVNNRWTRFIVFLLRDPHLLEVWVGSQDGATNPDRVPPFWWSNHLDFHLRWRKSSDLFFHSVDKTREHGRTTRQHGVSIQIFPDVVITFHDGVIAGFMDTNTFHSEE